MKPRLAVVPTVVLLLVLYIGACLVHDLHPLIKDALGGSRRSGSCEESWVLLDIVGRVKFLGADNCIGCLTFGVQGTKKAV